MAGKMVGSVMSSCLMSVSASPLKCADPDIQGASLDGLLWLLSAACSSSMRGPVTSGPSQHLHDFCCQLILPIGLADPRQAGT